MTRVSWSLLLWAVLALAVFSDLFDWRTRAAGFQFANAQRERRAHGQPLDTIEHGFRPLVRAAAAHSAAWPLLIFAAGTSATLVARRARTLGERERWREPKG